MEDLADFFVEDLHAFQIHGPVLADKGVIGIVGRDFDSVWVDGGFGVGGEIAMGIGDVVLGIKGLARCSFGPVDAVKGTFALEIEVGFSWFIEGRPRAVAGDRKAEAGRAG